MGGGVIPQMEAGGGTDKSKPTPIFGLKRLLSA